MNTSFHLKQQFKSLSALLFKAWIAYFFIFCIIISTAFLVFQIPPDYLTRDANATLKGPYYIGALSNLGIIFWTVAATLCLFGYFAVSKFAPASTLKKFLLHFGLVTAILLFDDLYMWHEEMFPKFLGVHEHWVYASYFLYFVYVLVKFRNTIFQTDYLILAAAFCFLGASVGCDFFDKKLIALFPFLAKSETLLEDTFKSMGVFTWMIYFIRVTFANLLPLLLQRKPELKPQASKKVQLYHAN